MNRRKSRLGKIKQEFFPIGFGGGALSGEGKGYGFGPISEKESLDLLHWVKEMGVHVFDLAPVYGLGTAEERVGKAFKNCRDEVFIIDKGGITWDENKRIDLDNSPNTIEGMLKNSLKTLQTDFIDLYIIHWPDPKIDIRFPLERLERARERGEIRYIGVGNTTREDLHKALEITQNLTIQNEFNFFNYDAYDSILTLFKEERVGLVGWGTLDKGILSGSVIDENRKFASEDARSWAPWWKKEKKLREKKFKAQKKIIELIDQFKTAGTLENNISLLDVSLNFSLSYEELGVALVGGRNRKQWEEIIQAADKTIDTEILHRIRDEVQKIMREK